MMWINGWERCNDVNKTMCNTGSGGWNWAHSILEPITTWQNIVSPYWARHIPTRNRSNRPIPSITQKRVNLLPIARASTKSNLPFGQEEESIGLCVYFVVKYFVCFTTRKKERSRSESQKLPTYDYWDWAFGGENKIK